MHQANFGPHSVFTPAEPWLSVHFLQMSIGTRLSPLHPVNTLQASSALSYVQTTALLTQRLRTAGDRALQHALTERQHPSGMKLFLDLSAACTMCAHVHVEGWRACWTSLRRLRQS